MRLPEARWVLPVQPRPGSVPTRQVSVGPPAQGWQALQPEPKKEKQLLGPGGSPAGAACSEGARPRAAFPGNSPGLSRPEARANPKGELRGGARR